MWRPYTAQLIVDGLMVAAGYSLRTLLSWNDDDFKLFFEGFGISKGPQLILKHAVKEVQGANAQQYATANRSWRAQNLQGSWGGGLEGGLSEDRPEQGHFGGSPWTGNGGTGDGNASVGGYEQPVDSGQQPGFGQWGGMGGNPGSMGGMGGMTQGASPWGGAAPAPGVAFGGGGLFMPMGQEQGSNSVSDIQAGDGQDADGSKPVGRGGPGGGGQSVPPEVMSYLAARKVTGVDSVIGMLGVTSLDDLRVLLPEDLEQLQMTPLQRRRLLNAIDDLKMGRAMGNIGGAGRPSTAAAQHSLPPAPAPMPEPVVEPAPTSAPAPALAPSRGWESKAVTEARLEAVIQVPNAHASTWQQQHLQQSGGTTQGDNSTNSTPTPHQNPSSQVMLSGDWICKCGEHNFARRTRCWKCRGRNIGNAVTVVGPTEKKAGKPGDWICGKCDADNFARRKQCYQCNSAKSDFVTAQGGSGAGGAGDGEIWDGKKACDWTCTNCSARNFKRNVRCFQCHSARATADSSAGGADGGGGNNSRQNAGGSGVGGSGGVWREQR